MPPIHDGQANRYAARLLIPEYPVKTEFDELNSDVAKLFDVSRPAMEIRLKTIGLGS